MQWKKYLLKKRSSNQAKFWKKSSLNILNYTLLTITEKLTEQKNFIYQQTNQIKRLLKKFKKYMKQNTMTLM